MGRKPTDKRDRKRKGDKGLENDGERVIKQHLTAS